jgi:uncharacterized iron-regulated protein
MMWLILAAFAAFAADGECSKTSIGKLTKVPRPTVLVLGERKGTLPDLARAKSIVSKLRKKGPVTLALQAVRADHQDALDRYVRGELPVETLPEALEWEATWGFPFSAYTRLLGTYAQGVKLVAVGKPYTARPADSALPLPPGYIHVLADPMGDNPVPVDLEAKYVEFVAWADHQLAADAIAAWDGQGALVIVVDRFHVEGGLGVQWQAQRLTDHPVVAAMLANGESRCYPGDQLLP